MEGGRGKRQEGIDSRGRGTEEGREGQEGRRDGREWEVNGWKKKFRSGVQRHSRRRKMHHKNPLETKK